MRIFTSCLAAAMPGATDMYFPLTDACDVLR